MNSDIYGLVLVALGLTIHIVWVNYRDGDVCHVFFPTFDVPNVMALFLVIVGIIVGAP